MGRIQARFNDEDYPMLSQQLESIPAGQRSRWVLMTLEQALRDDNILSVMENLMTEVLQEMDRRYPVHSAPPISEPPSPFSKTFQRSDEADDWKASLSGMSTSSW